MSMVATAGGGDQRSGTEVVLADMRDYFLEKLRDNVDSVRTVAGFSFAGSSQNAG